MVSFEHILKDVSQVIKYIPVLETHSIQPEDYEVCLVDQYGTPINSDNFPLLIDSFDVTGNFFIEIKLEPVEPTIHTPIGIQKVRLLESMNKHTENNLIISVKNVEIESILQ